MRAYLTFLLVAGMSLGLVFLLVTRTRTPHQAPAAVVEIEPAADAPDAGASAAPAHADAAADTVRPRAGHALQVATLGWELAAPGVAAMHGDAGASFVLAPEASRAAIEARLARGAGDPEGADVAILPLPELVASYEKLRAIEPRAFAVVGFSHGREVVHAKPGVLLHPLDSVSLVALAPSTASGPASARDSGSASATVLGLFAVGLAGAAPSQVRFTAPGTPEANVAPVSALRRGAEDARPLALSTADASRLVPLVAVATKADLEGRAADMAAFARAWLDGVGRMGAEAPAVARQLAAKDHVPLAAGVPAPPDAVKLVERLGQIEPATLADQGALLGPGAKGPVTLESLMARTWQLERGAGLTSSSAPDPLPIDARAVAAIGATATTKAPSTTPAPDGGADAGAPFGPVAAGATPLVVYRAPEGATAEQVEGEIGFLAGVFERAALRVSAKGGEREARRIARAAAEIYGIPDARLATDKRAPSGASAEIEILALP